MTASSYTPAVTEASEAPLEDPRPDDLRRAPSVVVLVNTGDGKGKSSAAFGVMIRAVARGWPVAVVQFVKSGEWNVGEEKIGRQLGVDWQRRRRLHVGLRRPRARQGGGPAGWHTAAEIIAAGEHRLVVLDEITYLCTWAWIDTTRSSPRYAIRPDDVNIIITGRDAPAEIIEIADTVTEMRKVKHAYDAGITAHARHRVLTWRTGRCGPCSPTSRHPTTRRWPRCTHAPPRSCGHRARWRGWTTSPHGWRGGNARRDRASNGPPPWCSRPTTGSPPPSP